MHKILITIAITMTLLTACDTPQAGYGGAAVDPETQALLAGATQDAATRAYFMTQTPIAATSQAIYAQQTAVSYNATSTQQGIYAEQTAVAYNVTATAAMTATWQAEETAVYKPVALRQTEEAQTVLMERESVASTATAVFIQAEIERSQKADERWDLFWQGFMCFLALVGLVLTFFLFAVSWRRVRPLAPVYDDNGVVIAIDRQLAETNVRRAARPTLLANPEYEEPEREPMFTAPMPTKTVRFTRQNGEQTTLNVNDRNPDIDPMKWQIFADAVLVHEIPPTRRAICEYSALISQDDHKLIYDHMIDNELATGNGAGGALSVNAEGYKFLVEKLPPHLWEEINLPHPEGLELVFE